MRNLTLLTDLYQLSMANAYFEEGIHEREAVFDLYFRQSGRINYAVAAGLQQACEYIESFRPDKSDLDYLRSLGKYSEGFLEFIANFKFTGDVWAVPEGSIVFPDEPLLTIKAPILQAQLLETALLNIINHQTLIATKASQICIAAEGGAVIEFGLRRAHGPDAGVYGARAAVIGGCVGTSNVLAAKMFGLKPMGTMSHSYIMCFPDELTAFREFAKIYPDDCLLLVDTYDTLKSGVPNAIKVLSEQKAKGHRIPGIRLDSGDLAYLSKQARKMLDAAGLEEAGIFASNEIDETLIGSLKTQGARIDSWGVGSKLITSEPNSSLGGVYKIAAFANPEGMLEPKIKVSNTLIKVTNPGFKTLYRLYENATGKAIADLIALRNEKLDFSDGFTIVHPSERWKKMELTDFHARELLVPVYGRGKRLYEFPAVDEISAYRQKELDTFWEETKRTVNPHIYKVDLSDGLFILKSQMLVR